MLDVAIIMKQILFCNNLIIVDNFPTFRPDALVILRAVVRRKVTMMAICKINFVPYKLELAQLGCHETFLQNILFVLQQIIQ